MGLVKKLLVTAAVATAMMANVAHAEEGAFPVLVSA